MTLLLHPIILKAVAEARIADLRGKRRPQGDKRKRVAATTDVTLRLERGDIHGILGANGSGKSTLSRVITGLRTLDTGRVEVFGHDIEREELAVKGLINRVSVDAAFFKKLSPMENLLFAARSDGLDGKTARAGAISIAGRIGISEKRVGRPVEQMSRGMQQKVANRASAADEARRCCSWTNQPPAWTRAASSTSRSSSRRSTRPMTRRSS